MKINFYEKYFQKNIIMIIIVIMSNVYHKQDADKTTKYLLSNIFLICN